MSSQEIPGSGCAPTRDHHGAAACGRCLRVRSEGGAGHAALEDDFGGRPEALLAEALQP